MIVMTGVHEAAPLPPMAFFRKPFDSATLLAVVERLHAARPAEAR